MSENENMKKVEIQPKQIELPKIDTTKHVGKKLPIATVETCKSNYGYCVKIETEVVEIIEGGKEDIQIKGSKIFGLQEDKDGQIGWGDKTKLGLFLKKMNCSTLGELKGKEVQLQIYTNKEGVDFLSFN